MNGAAFFAVAIGAVLGAYARWGLGGWLNAAHPHLPIGTFVANAIGGYVIGFAVAWFSQHPEVSPAYRLFLITGFLGALTTFSTFSAEAIALLMRGQYGWASVHICGHLFCSLLLTVAGIYTCRTLFPAAVLQ